MTTKLKLLLAGLILLSGFSVYYFVGVFKTSLIRGNAGPSTPTIELGSNDPDNDFDNDGLPDVEETQWDTDFKNKDSDGDGYLDGEEVSSGHHPRIPAPGDEINPAPKENVTEGVGSLVLAGLYEGSLKPKSPLYDQSVDEIVDEILRQSEINISTTEQNKIIALAPSEEHTKYYGAAISPLLKEIATENPAGLGRVFKAYSNLKRNSQSQKELEKAFNQEQARLQLQIERLENIPVPRDWVPQHDYLLTLLKKTSQSYTAVQNITTDPFQGMVAISTLADLLFKNLPETMKVFSKVYVE